MSQDSQELTLEELVPLIRAMRIQKIQTASEKFNDKMPSGAQLNTGISHEVLGNSIHFRIDYQLILQGTPDDRDDEVGNLQSSVVVTYLTDEPPHEKWERSAPLLSSMASRAGHPYLRQSISLLASELSFPSVTIGLLRYGSNLPESVSIADRAYPFSLTPPLNTQQAEVNTLVESELADR